MSQGRGAKKRFTPEEVEDLTRGVERFETGRWLEILECLDFHFDDRRTNVDLKDKWRNLVKYGAVQLSSSKKGQTPRSPITDQGAKACSSGSAPSSGKRKASGEGRADQKTAARAGKAHRQNERHVDVEADQQSRAPPPRSEDKKVKMEQKAMGRVERPEKEKAPKLTRFEGFGMFCGADEICFADNVMHLKRSAANSAAKKYMKRGKDSRGWKGGGWEEGGLFSGEFTHEGNVMLKVRVASFGVYSRGGSLEDVEKVFMVVFESGTPDRGQREFCLE